jgi:hypothetical protein
MHGNVWEIRVTITTVENISPTDHQPVSKLSSWLELDFYENCCWDGDTAAIYLHGNVKVDLRLFVCPTRTQEHWLLLARNGITFQMDSLSSPANRSSREKRLNQKHHV